MLHRRQPFRPIRETDPFRRKTLNRSELYPRVTIAIVARTFDHQHIVSVADMMQSFGDRIQGVDAGMLKITRLDARWGAAFAGHVDSVREVCDRARQKLGPFQQKRRAAAVIAAVREAYQEAREHAIVGRHLKMFGWDSTAACRQECIASPGNSIAAGFINKIEAFDLDVDLIVFGFDPEDGATIVKVLNPGVSLQNAPLDYWAVGSGMHVAFGVLNSRLPRLSKELPDLVYFTCEAKFAAESMPGVGFATNVILWRADGAIGFVDHEKLGVIRNAYLRDRSRPAPKLVARTVIEADRSAKIFPAISEDGS